jgi:hypothetical protein
MGFYSLINDTPAGKPMDDLAPENENGIIKSPFDSFMIFGADLESRIFTALRGAHPCSRKNHPLVRCPCMNIRFKLFVVPELLA